MWSGRSSALASARSALAPSDSFSLASLKAKLLKCEDAVRELTEEMLLQQREVKVLTAEKNTLEEALGFKHSATARQMLEEHSRVQREMRAAFSHEKEQRRRHQQEIDELRAMKVDMQQQVLALQQRQAQLLLQIGE